MSYTSSGANWFEESMEPGAWLSSILRIEESAPYTPPTPKEAPPPEGASPEQPEVAPEPPPPSAAGAFVKRYKAPLIAGAILVGFFWWRGRKR